MSNKKTDKKPTKAEIKKMEREQRTIFIGSVYETVLQSIAYAAMFSKRGVKIQCTHSKANRYVRFSIYGRHLAVLIYRDGNVELQFDEFCHKAYKEQIFSYSTDNDKQQTFLDNLDQLLEWLIPVFLEDEGPDFHTYMDYMDDADSPTAAYEAMMADWYSFGSEKAEPETSMEVSEDEAGHQ